MKSAVRKTALFYFRNYKEFLGTPFFVELFFHTKPIASNGGSERVLSEPLCMGRAIKIFLFSSADTLLSRKL